MTKWYWWMQRDRVYGFQMKEFPLDTAISQNSFMPRRSFSSEAFEMNCTDSFGARRSLIESGAFTRAGISTLPALMDRLEVGVK